MLERRGAAQQTIDGRRADLAKRYEATGAACQLLREIGNDTLKPNHHARQTCIASGFRSTRSLKSFGHSGQSQAPGVVGGRFFGTAMNMATMGRMTSLRQR